MKKYFLFIFIIILIVIAICYSINVNDNKTEKINKKGHHPVEAENESACIACAFCATMCPDCIITIEKE